jgi:hypothetical protein
MKGYSGLVSLSSLGFGLGEADGAVGLSQAAIVVEHTERAWSLKARGDTAEQSEGLTSRVPRTTGSTRKLLGRYETRLVHHTLPLPKSRSR